MKTTTKLTILSGFILSTLVFVFFATTPGIAMASSGTPGATIVLSQTSNVTVTFLSSSAGSNDQFGLSSPQNIVLGYGHSTAKGAQFALGQFSAGELIFFINHAAGQTWYTGPASRNSDNTIHAKVAIAGTNQWTIYFEDEQNGGDKDYNDIVLYVSATPTAITPSCTSHASKQCSGNSVYWYNSCGTQQEIYQQCSGSQTCSNGQCVNQNIACSSNSDCGANALTGSLFCQGNSVYQNYTTYTCNNPGTATSSCSSSVASQLQTSCSSSQSCSNGSCGNTCTSNYQERCQGNSIYWYDSCGNQQSFIQTCSNGCSGNSCVTQPTCTSNYQERCQGNSIYWYDSCGNQQSFIQTCSNGCSGNSCVTQPTCTSNYQERCQGNSIYWYDSCGNQQSFIQTCSNGCSGNSCQSYNNNNYNNNYNYVNTCASNSYERCVGSNLYWYDSCGNQQNLIQYCSNGCYNNTCGNNYNNNYNNSYGNCTYHAYKLCSGNSVYWYDSCGTQQDLYYNCGGGQTCQNGQCTSYIQPVQPIQNYNNYIAHYKTACYGSSLYWYDSLGAASGLYKNCSDNNSCTLDACSSNKCLNTLKCDGSTCVVGSADYNTYCLPAQAGATTPVNNQNHCGNGLCETTLGETTANCPSDCKLNTSVNGLSTSFFTKQDLNSNQWQKTAQVNSNGQIYFMISVTNNSVAEIDNINVSANIPNEISSLGNLQLNGVPVSGDIISGINIGSIAPTSTKSVTFEGKAQTLSASATEQAIATTNVSGNNQSDSVSINLNPAQVAAAVSAAPVSSGFLGFLKRWYLWILAGLILIFLFIAVYRRFSSDV